MSCCCQLSAIRERQKNKAPFQLVQSIIGFITVAENDSAEREACHRFAYRKAPPRAFGSDTVPFLPAYILPFFASSYPKAEKLSLPQLAKWSQVSTLFECDYNPNYTRTVVLAYLPAAHKHISRKMWTLCHKMSVTLLEKLKDRRER